MVRRLLVAAAVPGALAAACGDSGPVAPVDPPDSTSAAVASVTIAPGAIQFGALGSRVQLTATVQAAGGATLSGVPVTWALVGNGVASLSPFGLLHAVANGTDTVTATADGVVGRALVTVAQVVTQLAVSGPPGPVRVVGDTLVLSASLSDSNGHAVSGVAPGPVAWTSSDAAVVLAESGGRIIAAGIGSAMVTAASDGHEGGTTVTVAPLGPDGEAIVGAAVPCSGTAGPFPCSGSVTLLAYLPLGGIGARDGVAVNDLWGWTDPATGEEWALVGREDGTAFVNVTDPVRPVYAGFLPRTAGSPQSLWRDLKVHADHAFIVSDNAGQHGVQVFDLRGLRGVAGPPRVFGETARYTGVASVHNIAINEATGYAYAVGSGGGGQTCGGGLHMIDVRAPAAPVFAGCFADPATGYSPGYTHDVQCVLYHGPDPDYQGREICFGLNENMLSVADVTDKANPVAIARASYPDVRYAHQGWLSGDHRYFYSDDELDESAGVAATSRTIVWDVTDLSDPLPVHEHFGPTAATDHNLYVHGDRLFASNYQFGIRVLDLTNPTAPAELASFDTAPGRPDAPGFGGSWSNYPFFASGIVVVTSRDEGLVVLRID